MCGGPCTRTNLTLRHQTEVLRNAFRHLRGAPGTLVSGVAAHNTTTSRGSAGHALEGKEVASFEPSHVERAVRFLRPPCNTLGFHLLQRCTAGGLVTLTTCAAGVQPTTHVVRAKHGCERAVHLRAFRWDHTYPA